jgi:hypothetical protein
MSAVVDRDHHQQFNEGKSGSHGRCSSRFHERQSHFEVKRATDSIPDIHPLFYRAGQSFPKANE